MRSHVTNLIRVALLSAVVALLVAAPSALASASASGYSGVGGETQSTIVPGGSGGVGGSGSSSPHGSVASANKSSLPFTGLDLAFVIAAGVALLLAGTGLRRLTRRQRA